MRSSEIAHKGKRKRRWRAMPVLIGLMACLALTVGCGVSSLEGEKAQTEVVVFAAASLTECLTEIGQDFEKEHENVKVIFNFDSSGTLKTQIEEGAPCDIFFSAAEKQMDQLDISKPETVNPQRLDFVDTSYRKDMLENTAVLAVAEGNPVGIQGFSDLKNKCKLLALGNKDVPVGQYSLEILENIDLLEGMEAEGRITYGSNVKEVTSQIATGVADCGIVYLTDALAENLTIVESAGTDLCSRILYPATILKTAKNKAQAEAFFAYMQTEQSMRIFEKAGFVRGQ